jgi:hypothetical protein
LQGEVVVGQHRAFLDLADKLDEVQPVGEDEQGQLAGPGRFALLEAQHLLGQGKLLLHALAQRLELGLAGGAVEQQVGRLVVSDVLDGQFLQQRLGGLLLLLDADRRVLFGLGVCRSE